LPLRAANTHAPGEASLFDYDAQTAQNKRQRSANEERGAAHRAWFVPSPQHDGFCHAWPSLCSPLRPLNTDFDDEYVPVLPGRALRLLRHHTLARIPIPQQSRSPTLGSARARAQTALGLSDTDRSSKEDSIESNDGDDEVSLSSEAARSALRTPLDPRSFVTHTHTIQ
jgi:hypothetical protein